MFEIKIDITGIPEVQERLENISGKILQGAYWEIFNTVKDEIIPKAKEYCPEHSGDLKNSIRAEATGPFAKGVKAKEWTVIMKAGNEKVNYAEAVEFGFELTKEGMKAMAIKKGGIVPYTGLTVPRLIPGRYFMTNAKNFAIPRLLDRLDKKINELTR